MLVRGTMVQQQLHARLLLYLPPPKNMPVGDLTIQNWFLGLFCQSLNVSTVQFCAWSCENKIFKKGPVFNYHLQSYRHNYRYQPCNSRDKLKWVNVLILKCL